MSSETTVYDTMTTAEALNVAWNARVNGMGIISNEKATAAFAAFEAEVKRLREERELATSAHTATELRIVELRAKIERVEGTASVLREAATVIGDDAISDLAKACRDTLRQAADDIEAALKDGP
jgi:hypothetical protein